MGDFPPIILLYPWVEVETVENSWWCFIIIIWNDNSENIFVSFLAVGPPYTFRMRIKFYSSEPNNLHEEITRWVSRPILYDHCFEVVVAIRVYHAFFYPTSRSISKRGKDSSWSVQCNVMLMVELPILHGTLQDNALSARCIAVPFSNTHNRIRIYMQKVKSVVSKKKAKIQMASKIILLYFWRLTCLLCVIRRQIENSKK